METVESLQADAEIEHLAFNGPHRLPLGSLVTIVIPKRNPRYNS